MNILKKFWLFLVSFIPSSSKTIVVANENAIKKMEEFDNSILLEKVLKMERTISELMKTVTSMHEIIKVNQEFILYLCTSHEELLNILSNSEEIGSIPTTSSPCSIHGPSCDEEHTEDEILMLNPITLKKNLVN